MNICMTGSEIAPTRNNVIVGGVANSVIRLSQGLVAKGNHIDIVTSRPRIYDNNVIDFGFSIYQIPLTQKYPSFQYGAELVLKSLMAIQKQNKTADYDIIHGHSGEPQVALLPNIAGKILSKPALYTLYCPIRPGDRSAKICLSGISQIIAITENVKESLIKKRIPSEKIVVIPPAIDTKKYNPDVSGKKMREKLGLKRDDYILLFVGNLTSTKGIDILLNSLRVLKTKFSHIKLLITLEMPHGDFLNRKNEILVKIDRYHLHEHIIEFGIIDNMAELIAASDALVAPFLDTYGPSDYPLPVLEAMAIGKPVIVTNIGGMPEIIENLKNGLLIPPNDVTSLTYAITYLLENTLMQNSMGSCACRLIQEKFSIPVVTNEMEAVYGQFYRK